MRTRAGSERPFENVENVTRVAMSRAPISFPFPSLVLLCGDDCEGVVVENRSGLGEARTFWWAYQGNDWGYVAMAENYQRQLDDAFRIHFLCCML